MENRSVRGGTLGRTVVSVTAEGTVRCDCTRIKQSRWCTHKTLVLWYLKQNHENLLLTLKEKEYDNVIDEDTLETGGERLWYPPVDKEQLSKLVSYIHTFKRIPCICKATFSGKTTAFEPEETVCVCGGPLTESYLVTNKAKVVLRDRILTGIPINVSTNCSLISLCYLITERPVA